MRVAVGMGWEMFGRLRGRLVGGGREGEGGAGRG